MAKETDVAVTQEAPEFDISIWQKEGPIVGLEAVSAEDFKIPKLKLVQLNSPEVLEGKAKAGQYYNTVTGEVFDTVDVNLLFLGKLRAMFQKPYETGSRALCSSPDAIVSATGTKCATCPKKDWPEDKEKTPECSLSYAWMGTYKSPSGERQVFRLISSGKSVAEAKDVVAYIGTKRVAPFVYVYTLSSELVKDKKGNYFVQKYTRKDTIKTQDEYDALEKVQLEFKSIFDLLKQRDSSMMGEDHVAGANVVAGEEKKENFF